MAAWDEPRRSREPYGVLAVSAVLMVSGGLFGAWELWRLLGKNPL